MTISQSRIEQLEKWAKGLGYPNSDESALLRVRTTDGDLSSYWTLSISSILKCNVTPLGILDVNNVWHPVPDPIPEVSEYEEMRGRLTKHEPGMDVLYFILNKLESLEKEKTKDVGFQAFEDLRCRDDLYKLTKRFDELEKRLQSQLQSPFVPCTGPTCSVPYGVNIK